MGHRSRLQPLALTLAAGVAALLCSEAARATRVPAAPTGPGADPVDLELGEERLPEIETGVEQLPLNLSAAPEADPLGTLAGGPVAASAPEAAPGPGDLAREEDPELQAGSWLVLSVPEPATWALVGLGLCGLALGGRRPSPPARIVHRSGLGLPR